jgi:hypothetical protein
VQYTASNGGRFDFRPPTLRPLRRRALRRIGPGFVARRAVCWPCASLWARLRHSPTGELVGRRSRTLRLGAHRDGPQQYARERGTNRMPLSAWKALLTFSPWARSSSKNVAAGCREKGEGLECHEGDDNAPTLNRWLSGASTMRTPSRRTSADIPAHARPMAVAVAIPTGNTDALQLPVARAVSMPCMLTDWLLELERPQDSVLAQAKAERERDLALRPPIPAHAHGSLSSRMTGSAVPSADDSIDEHFAARRLRSASRQPSSATQAQPTQHSLPEDALPGSSVHLSTRGCPDDGSVGAEKGAELAPARAKPGDAAAPHGFAVPLDMAA